MPLLPVWATIRIEVAYRAHALAAGAVALLVHMEAVLRIRRQPAHLTMTLPPLWTKCTVTVAALPVVDIKFTLA